MRTSSQDALVKGAMSQDHRLRGLLGRLGLTKGKQNLAKAMISSARSVIISAARNKTSISE